MINHKKEIEQIEKDNEYIMNRMHPAVILPGLFIGLMAAIGSIYKVYMGW